MTFQSTTTYCYRGAIERRLLPYKHIHHFCKKQKRKGVRKCEKSRIGLDKIYWQLIQDFSSICEIRSFTWIWRLRFSTRWIGLGCGSCGWGGGITWITTTSSFSPFPPWPAICCCSWPRCWTSSFRFWYSRSQPGVRFSTVEDKMQHTLAYGVGFYVHSAPVLALRSQVIKSVQQLHCGWIHQMNICII